MAAIVLAIGLWTMLPNLPPSPIRDRLQFVWEPAVEAGYVQDWEIFSPDPRELSIDLQAEIEMASGDVVLWNVPEYDPLIGALREYRWNTWQDRVRRNSRDYLWGATAQWIRLEHADQHPVRVTLIRRWIEHGPLTASGYVDIPESGWSEFRFCTWPANSDGATESCGS